MQQATFRKLSILGHPRILITAKPLGIGHPPAVAIALKTPRTQRCRQLSAPPSAVEGQFPTPGQTTD